MVKLTFQQVRILILIGIFIYVVAEQSLAEYRTTSWQDTLTVVIYPINGDASQASKQTINTLDVSQFSSISRYIQQQAQIYGVAIKKPIDIKLAPQIHKKPPRLPALDSHVLKVMWWSLRMRWWAWFENTYSGEKDIRLFVEYYADESTDSHVSVGLQKGLLSLIKNYTGDDYVERNNVIIAHEMLHTLGATDKYDPSTLLPIFPIGYAQPELGINQPQVKAEIMGGRIPVSSEIALVPSSLDYCMIGEITAREIGWIKD